MLIMVETYIEKHKNQMRVKHVTITTYHDGKLCKHSLMLGKVVRVIN